MTQSIFCWEHTRVLWEKAAAWFPGHTASFLLIKTKKSLQKLHVLYLTPIAWCSLHLWWGQKPPWVRCGARTTFPHSLCALHTCPVRHWRLSSLFQGMDISSYRRTARLNSGMDAQQPSRVIYYGDEILNISKMVAEFACPSTTQWGC